MLFLKAFFIANFVLPQLLRMTFHNEILQVLEAFAYSLSQNNPHFLNCFELVMVNPNL